MAGLPPTGPTSEWAGPWPPADLTVLAADCREVTTDSDVGQATIEGGNACAFFLRGQEDTTVWQLEPGAGAQLRQFDGSVPREGQFLHVQVRQGRPDILQPVLSGRHHQHLGKGQRVGGEIIIDLVGEKASARPWNASSLSR